MLDLIIKNGKCYIDGQLKDVNISVKDGKIQNIGQITEDAKDTIDATGLIVLPGCMDTCLLYTSPSPRDVRSSRMPSSA